MTSQLLLDRLRDDVVEVVDTVLSLSDVRHTLIVTSYLDSIGVNCHVDLCPVPR